eukprot:GHVQ01043216.1.p1 GENE.GHVQ01043216.1~~GHVQ01043216.1.p1  ORF type:complete len:116 (-),score=2.52 GHVQ01043216.1:65-412(-)
MCYTGKDGLLYSVKSRRLFVPAKYRHVLLYWCHAGPYGGHRGINTTTRKLKQYAWWPNMHQDVKAFVKGCLPCSRNRPPLRSTTSMALLIPSATELISLDFVGPRKVHGDDWHYL